MFKHPFVCIATTRTTSILRKKKTFHHLNEALLPIYPVSEPRTISPLLFLFLYFPLFLHFCFILRCVHCHSFGSCHGKTEHTQWWFIPAFPGPLRIVAQQMLLLFFFFFVSSPFFSCTIFFQPGTSTCVWWVCHCGPPSLFVYHSLLQATVTTQSCWQSTGNAFLTMTAILPPRPRRLSSVASLSCVSSSLSAIGLAAGALQCSVPSQRVGFWRIVSSHFVLGEVSNGPWKDGSHLSPRWLWPMVTCLQ